jgi:hypothetical protein
MPARHGLVAVVGARVAVGWQAAPAGVCAASCGGGLAGGGGWRARGRDAPAGGTGIVGLVGRKKKKEKKEYSSNMPYCSFLLRIYSA